MQIKYQGKVVQIKYWGESSVDIALGRKQCRLNTRDKVVQIKYLGESSVD